MVNGATPPLPDSVMICPLAVWAMDTFAELLSWKFRLVDPDGGGSSASDEASSVLEFVPPSKLKLRTNALRAIATPDTPTSR